MILHLVLRRDWEALPPAQHYVAESVAKEGFIHCTGDQAGLLKVANTFYRAIGGEFWVLEIDEAKVNALVKWEAPAHAVTQPAPPPVSVVSPIAPPTGLPPEVTNEMGSSSARAAPTPAEIVAVALPVQFPHIYGALNRDAVTGIRPMLRAVDGAFIGYGELLNITVAAQVVLAQPPQPAAKPIPHSPPQPVAAPVSLDKRTPIVKAADDLLDATDQFSEELKRLRGRVEAKISSLDEEIAKL